MPNTSLVLSALLLVLTTATGYHSPHASARNHRAPSVRMATALERAPMMAAAPPVGACYRSSALIPGVSQLFTLKLDITGRTTARLQLSGPPLFSVSDSVVYEQEQLNDGSSRFVARLGPNVDRFLRALDISLVDALYSAQTDSAHITIKPPGLQALRINLRRVHPPSSLARRTARVVTSVRAPARLSLPPTRNVAPTAKVARAAAATAPLLDDAAGGSEPGGESIAELRAELQSSAGALLETGVQTVQRELQRLWQSRERKSLASTLTSSSVSAEEDSERLGESRVREGGRGSALGPRAASELSAAGAPSAAVDAQPAPLPTVPTAAAASADDAAAADEQPTPVRPGLPPVGAIYSRTLTLPVIGSQSVTLSILGLSAARIQLAGALNLNELLEYRYDRGLAFVLSEPTQKLLRGMGVALTGADYTAQGDIAAVTIKPPAIPAIRIALDRVAGQSPAAALESRRLNGSGKR